MTQKILTLVSSCEQCPRYKYGTGGGYECREVGEIVRDKGELAPFCPLPDYPSAVIAKMDTTIRTLREPNKYGLVVAILSHLATKLKVNLDTHGMNIPTKDGDIYLFHEAITDISLQDSSVYFISGDRKFRLLPDGDRPKLYEAIKAEGIEKELWRECTLV